VSFGSYAPDVVRDFLGDSQRGVLSLAVLPYHAWMNTDATIRGLWRRLVSGKRLLEWETAAEAEKRAGSELASFWRAHRVEIVLFAAIFAFGVFMRVYRFQGTLSPPDGLCCEERSRRRRACKALQGQRPLNFLITLGAAASCSSARTRWACAPSSCG
jgi:hypothetical protein